MKTKKKYINKRSYEHSENDQLPYLYIKNLYFAKSRKPIPEEPLTLIIRKEYLYFHIDVFIRKSSHDNASNIKDTNKNDLSRYKNFNIILKIISHINSIYDFVITFIRTIEKLQ